MVIFALAIPLGSSLPTRGNAEKQISLFHVTQWFPNRLGLVPLVGLVMAMLWLVGRYIMPEIVRITPLIQDL